MRPGVRLGVDVGSVRVGVSVSDPDGVLATPWRTLTRDPAADTDVVQVAELAARRGAVEVVVGLPLHLNGQEGQAAHTARAWARSLQRRLPQATVRMVDERLTTVEAHRAMHDAGRSERGSRAVIDQQAAVLILQSTLDGERRTGRAPGRVLGERKPRHRARQARPEGQR